MRKVRTGGDENADGGVESLDDDRSWRGLARSEEKVCQYFGLGAVTVHCGRERRPGISLDATTSITIPTILLLYLAEEAKPPAVRKSVQSTLVEFHSWRSLEPRM
jgi:hypothetical protein